MFTIVGMRKYQVTRDLKHQRHRVNIHTRGSEKDAIPIGRDRAKAKPQRMRKQERRNIRKKWTKTMPGEQANRWILL
ncbi:hypothetical protein BCIN_16g04100 [Botrytis cinerea B05.10]|uniref:Uncharacterized protein n=1 Tax=Botryotinia fuckeliana (strain B05.10) TaxID=332648 RepID=A0A384K7B7_BOTFB|nr:hypothetical protein BCIN_16g04100 [Botrytis cinerea B05.10]ATZ58706.1 hypothetical protein BCIN_16g04100 [Botrytis cinerea B05.10]